MTSTTPPDRYCPECGAATRTAADARCFACGALLDHAAPPPAANSELLAPGDLLHGRYRIINQVGTGGYGAVYRARDTPAGDKTVAIKAIHLRGLKPQEAIEATDTFNREVSLLSGLSHPNLPRVYDHFTDAAHWFLVMDFIEGETLEDYVKHTATTGQLPLTDVLEIGIQLCTVLDYLHTRQPPIIFRDVKPANVMRTRAGHLYVIDFGIARRHKPGQLRDTTALGSPGYAAPEQYGRSQTTAQTDIYSLGVTLHQLLTGHDPAEILFHLPPLDSLAPHLPPALTVLIDRMLDLDASKRPGSMAEVQTALRDIAHESRRGLVALPPASTAFVSSVPPGTGQATGTPSGQQQLILEGSRQRPPLPRRGLSRRSVLIGASAGLLALGGTLTWRWLARPQPPPAPSPVTTSLPAPPIGVSGVGGGAEWSTLTVAESVVYVGPAHDTVYAIDASMGQQLWAFPARNATSDWGSWVHPAPTVVDSVVYIGSGDRKVYAIDARTGHQLWAFPTGGEVRSSPTVSNGVLYVGSWDHKVYAIDTRTGQKKWAVPTSAPVHLSPTIVKGVVYVGANDGMVSAIDARTGQQRWAVPTGASAPGVDSPLSSPIVANGVVYVSSGDNKVHALDARTGQQLWAFGLGWNGFATGVISPAMVVTGVLYIGLIDGRVCALNAQTGQEKWAVPVNGGVYAALTVVNGIVYVISIPGIVYAIESETGQQQWAVPTGNATGDWVQPPPIVVDDMVYVSADDQKVYAIDARTGHRQWAVPTDSQGRFSPVVVNGVMYMTGTDDGQVYAIDATSGQPRWTFST